MDIDPVQYEQFKKIIIDSGNLSIGGKPTEEMMSNEQIRTAHGATRVDYKTYLKLGNGPSITERPKDERGRIDALTAQLKSYGGHILLVQAGPAPPGEGKLAMLKEKRIHLSLDLISDPKLAHDKDREAAMSIRFSMSGEAYARIRDLIRSSPNLPAKLFLEIMASRFRHFVPETHVSDVRLHLPK